MDPDTATDGTALTDELAALARAAPAGTASTARPSTGSPTTESLTTGKAPEPSLLADRPDGTVVRVGAVVAKAHAAGTDPASLEIRLRLAAAPELAGILLPPLAPAAVPDPGAARPATLWPYGTPVDPEEPLAAPWEAAGTLLARLHSVAPGPLEERLPGPLPPMRGPAKAAAAVERMRAAAAGPTGRRHRTAREAVLRVWAGLPAWCRGEHPGGTSSTGGTGSTGRAARTVCHGDFHLGQLVRHPPPDGGWLLIDIDDLGVGDPAWDLARPACWYAAGLLPPDAWERLLGAYQHTLGTPGADPWPRLDAPARTLTAQSAALAVAKASAAGRALDEDEDALVESCHRIVQLAAGRGP